MTGAMRLAEAEAIAAALVAAGATVARAYPSTTVAGGHEVRVRFGNFRQTITRAEEVPRLLHRVTQGAVPTTQEILEAEEDGRAEYTEGTDLLGTGRADPFRATP